VRKNLGPSELGDLLELPILAVLATRRADGGLLLSPVWHRWRDGGFDVVSRSDDVKVRHLRRDPRANIVVCEHVRPYRGLELRCEARLLTDGSEDAVAPIAIRYMGPEAGGRYAETEPDDILIRLEPGVLRGWDFADDWPAED
jgi:PPOX class probable F420-dependent enzyme